MDEEVRQCLFNVSERIIGLADKIEKLEKRTDSLEENSGKIHLEVGKLYRTRDNQKAFISKYDADKTNYKYIGIIAGESGTTTWKGNGCFNIGDARTSRDIIGEWTE